MKSRNVELLCEVDEKDKVLRPVFYHHVYSKKIRHRVVHSLVFDSNRRILIQRRSANKSFCPLYWSSSAQGHVRYCESYVSSALRETKEEIGIAVRPTFIGKFKYVSDLEKFVGLCVSFSDQIASPNRLDLDCIEKINVEDLGNFLRGKDVHPEFEEILKRFDIGLVYNNLIRSNYRVVTKR